MKPLLVVDGYNILGAWSEVQRRGWTLEESRSQLLHVLQDYGGYAGLDIVLVFDGYMSDRRTRTEEQYGPVRLVYTQHAETADSYIERFVAEQPRYLSVTVATNDGLEQSQVLSTGATRMTARELLRELSQTRKSALQASQRRGVPSGAKLEDRLPEEQRRRLEALRRGDQ